MSSSVNEDGSEGANGIFAVAEDVKDSSVASPSASKPCHYLALIFSCSKFKKQW